MFFFTAQCYTYHSYATVCRLSACLSVHSSVHCIQVPWSHRLEYFENNFMAEQLKRHLLTSTPTWVIWCNGNTPKIGVEQGWGQEHKPAISPKWCKIGPRLLEQANRKSHTRFRLVPKSMTLDDLERPKRHFCRNKTVLQSPP